jgi:hypothetical protein
VVIPHNVRVVLPQSEGNEVNKQLAKVLAQNPGLDYRDTRDLMMEYGADGITAGKLAEGRPGTPGE